MDCFTTSAEGAVPVRIVTRDGLEAWMQQATTAEANWVRAHKFDASPARHIVVPGKDGGIGQVLVARADPAGPFVLGDLQGALPEGTVVRLADEPGVLDANTLAIGFALGSYRFDRYRKAARALVRMVSPAQADMARVEAIAESIALGRDLINTPAEDMGPAELTGAIDALARANHAEVRLIEGDDLLDQNYPSIHAVGRASSRPPRLIDVTWGNPDAPKVTLVGKGVCFDSGGLDLKPAAGMKMMKKDMGGAASVTALASMIMRTGLKVRLRLLVPAVENSVAGNAFRPMDVITTRKGITIEIGNTDAEGRVILCDALAEACSEKPELLIDMATLTGAARVAVGSELAALFSNDDKLAEEVMRHGARVEDAAWRLPLWQNYRSMIEGEVGEISNSGTGPGAGAITAALFLESFVDKDIPWAHFDIMGWNNSARPGRPKGGEVMAVRALFSMLEERYGA
jgi:leucyl aminopeptidase